MDTATALAQAASQLHASARAHKRAEFHHRRQARELMRALAQLRQACAELGITLAIDEDPGGHGHDAQQHP